MRQTWSRQHGVGNSKTKPSTRITPENRRPPKIVERIVHALAPFDTEPHLLDLRRRYRNTLRKKGEKAARRFAYREAVNWVIWAGIVPILHFIFRVGPAS
jgi:hypothetical protein